MKKKLITLTTSIAISFVLLAMTILFTGCDSDDNGGSCPTGMRRLGSAASDTACLTMCSNATPAGQVAIWHRMSNGTCCCT